MSQLLAQAFDHRLIPVVVLDEVGQAEGLADALVSGGLPVAEVTFRTPAAPEAIAVMRQHEDLLVGAGTVLNIEQADRAISAGAQFVVSPGLDPAVVKHCQSLEVPVLPGAVTATEVQQALALGLSTVKFFPAETSGGARAIGALAAPFGQVSFVPTGGVGPKNLADYLALDCVAAVGGSWMVPRNLIAAGDFDAICALVKEAVALTSQSGTKS